MLINSSKIQFNFFPCHNILVTRAEKIVDNLFLKSKFIYSVYKDSNLSFFLEEINFSFNLSDNFPHCSHCLEWKGWVLWNLKNGCTQTHTVLHTQMQVLRYISRLLWGNHQKHNKNSILKLRILKLFCIYDLVTTYLHIHVTIFLSFKSLKRFVWNPGLGYYIMYHYTVYA